MWLFFLLHPLVFIFVGLSTQCFGLKLSKPKSSNSSQKDVEAQRDFTPSEQEIRIVMEEYVISDDEEEEVDNDGGSTDTSLDSSSLLDDTSSDSSDSEDDGDSFDYIYRPDGDHSEVYVDVEDEITCKLAATAECNNFADSGVEAKMRHKEMADHPLKPVYELGNIVTRRQSHTFFFHRGLPKHKRLRQMVLNDEQREQQLARMEDKFMDTEVTFSEEATVNVVYGHDPVRGECDFDEVTMDDLDFKSRHALEENIDKMLCGRGFMQQQFFR